MENRSQNGLRHSSVVSIEKGRGAGRGMQHPVKLIDASVWTCVREFDVTSNPSRSRTSFSRRCDALYVGYDDSRGYALG